MNDTFVKLLLPAGLISLAACCFWLAFYPRELFAALFFRKYFDEPRSLAACVVSWVILACAMLGLTMLVGMTVTVRQDDYDAALCRAAAYGHECGRHELPLEAVTNNVVRFWGKNAKR
jgi:hypothetical protein